MDAKDKKIAELEKQVLELKRMIQQLDHRGRATMKQVDVVKNATRRNSNEISSIAMKLSRSGTY